MNRWSFIFIMMFFVACSPQKRLQRIIKKHPHLSVTETVIERDTVRIDSLRTVTEFQTIIDSTAIDSLFMRFKEVSQQLVVAPTPEHVNRLEATIDALKRNIAFEFTIDTSFVIVIPRQVMIGDSVFTLNTSIDIIMTDGEIVHTLEADALRIPYEKTTVITKVDAKPTPIYARWWFWLIVAAIILLVYRKK